MKKFVFLLLLSTRTFALDTAQITALNTFALNDPTASACIAAGDDGCLYNFMKTDTTFVVWRTNVSQSEIMQSSTFDWTRVDNLTTGKARVWDLMFKTPTGTLNASKANIRSGIDATWVGTAADLAVRASVYEKCKRFANQAEKVLATGTGTTGDPGVLTFEGVVPFSEIVKIRVGHE